MEAVVYRGGMDDRVGLPAVVAHEMSGRAAAVAIAEAIRPIDEVDAAFQALEAGGDVMKILLDWRGSV